MPSLTNVTFLQALGLILVLELPSDWNTALRRTVFAKLVVPTALLVNAALRMRLGVKLLVLVPTEVNTT